MTFESLLLRSLLEGPLLVGDLPEAPAFDVARLALPEHLPTLSTGQKLGHLYEAALAVLLEASPHHELLARNLQIQRDRHDTLGELDFLLRDQKRGELIHLELAVKFYLVVQSGDDITLPGPNARDHYFKKLHRLRSHQLLLTSKYRDHLPGPFRDRHLQVRHLIQGCLFDRIDAPSLHRPEFLHPEARRGKWLPLHELRGHLAVGTTLRLIPKPLWPVLPEFLKTFPLEEFKIPETLDRCVMVLPSTEDQAWMITPVSYPGQSPDRILK